MRTRFHEEYENVDTPSHLIAKCYRLELDKAEPERNPEISLGVVHYRGGQEEFDLGLLYCRSFDSLDRSVGAELLGQLGWSDVTFRDESLEVLIPLLKDPEPQVISSAAVALHHRSDSRVVAPLVKLAGHPDPLIRFGVAFGLLAQEAPAAIDAIIQLSRDTDEDTRNWAMFGLGSQIETDTPEIRAALWVGLADANLEVRGEALLGLAERGDVRVVDALILEWEAGNVSRLSFEAAGKIADSRLIPRLVELRDTRHWADHDYLYGYLLEAITACGAKPASHPPGGNGA